MYGGILGLHSLLRWALVILLIVNIIKVNVETTEKSDIVDKKWRVILLAVTHLNLLIALYLYFFGDNGLPLLSAQKYTSKDVMKLPWLRFWIIEHPTMMLTSIILITVSHIFSKRDIAPPKKKRILNTLYILAFVIIIAAIPWPFRAEGIARPIFRGLYQ